MDHPDHAGAVPSAVSFTELGLPAQVLRVLTDRGVREPFPIQAATLPDALAGRDVLGRGRTGSGKTLAFGLPLLVRTAGQRAEAKQPLALILVPTRELAQQVTEALAPYAEALRLRMAAVVGGMSIGRQIAALREGAEVVVATPGRLHDLVERKACRLGRVRITVLDEADQMCDMGFLPQVTEVLDQVRPEGQRMLFSATLDRDVDHLVSSFLQDPVVHSVDPSAGAVTTMDHHLLVVHGPDRYAVTTEIAARDGRVLLFLDTKHGVDQLTRHLRASGVHAAALHSGKSQPQRTRTLAQFKDGQVTALVATNVAARGLHIDDLDLVVNVDPPTDTKDYLHRAGRTARAGETGRVVTLVLSGQRRETSRVLAEAGIAPTVTKVRSGEAVLSRITGAKAPSGTPLDGGPAVPRPKNTNAPFRGLGTSKDSSRGTGGKSRKAGEARKLAEARRAAQVRRGG
ncbi:superfamily II DNA/RNA helicase [Streptomyces sp. SAI-208]|uniref:DEAD/DEAH box helicase n=1 Tax=unclassified Streptomyces TaxID=2593676 RepID=UPI0024740CC0|nr:MULTISPECIES: DEAD/DEAH box helicase [unclassified Streptomyces]MDH6521301.1 superfamily II DNA/RNA helicase [Streptomyces sp. SAI-090]MDH6553524.1 superfamily II DNA/RNA helicase [Streptomyces sp. SAI-041]MDH6572606.1 superfamily II DNA/RNA helicase [Streptomyces sp. SAI-117]MDH6582434.1 superfamily II DNA/RNA helicase [Streptomyces sp. SAI-133]MDH6612300.1 superfamily II DNA/RNA helicase [Streptomyces sp. SAI-208]